MIPIRDSLRSRRVPVVTLALILANVGVFAAQVLATDTGLPVEHALVPARLYASLGGPIGSGVDVRGAPREVFTVLSAMFMHGGLGHLLGNMWFLWIFGDNVEDRFGRSGFLGFYLIAGVAAAASQFAAEPTSAIPMIGASGAVAGVLGAYLRLYPRARVLTVIPVFVFLHFTELPAALFLVFWFAVQIVSSLLSVAGVAWWAHIAGFVVGLLLSFAAPGGTPAPRRPAPPRRRGRAGYRGA